MATKILTEKRGPLQGVDVSSIVTSAYGSGARYREDPDGVFAGLVVKPRGGKAYDVLDSIVEVHEE